MAYPYSNANPYNPYANSTPNNIFAQDHLETSRGREGTVDLFTRSTRNRLMRGDRFRADNIIADAERGFNELIAQMAGRGETNQPTFDAYLRHNIDRPEKYGGLGLNERLVAASQGFAERNSNLIRNVRKVSY